MRKESLAFTTPFSAKKTNKKKKPHFFSVCPYFIYMYIYIRIIFFIQKICPVTKSTPLNGQILLRTLKMHSEYQHFLSQKRKKNKEEAPSSRQKKLHKQNQNTPVQTWLCSDSLTVLPSHQHVLELLVKCGRWSNLNRSEPNLGERWGQLCWRSPKAK